MNTKTLKQALFIVFTIVIMTTFTSFANEKRAVCFGENLSESEKTSLYDTFGIKDSDIETIPAITVSNEEERKWLSEYVEDDIIGTRALSSSYVELTEPGKGIEVTTDKITFCTPQMYKNALQTAGVTDAKIIAAAPFEMSGTASLIGVLKAYEKITGTPISEECIDAAVNEFVLTGELVEEADKEFSAEELISYLKEEVSSKELVAEDIKKLIVTETKKRDIELDEEKIDGLVKLLVKIQEIKTVPEIVDEKTSTQTYSTGKNNKSQTFEGNYNTNTQSIGFVFLNKIKAFFESIFSIFK